MIKLLKNKKVIIGLAVLCVASGSIYFVNANAQGTEEVSTTQTYVRTTTLTKGSIDETISSTGVISSTNTTAVSSSLQGVKIASVLVEVGDIVNEGDTLITLEQDQLNEKISELNEDIQEEKDNLQDLYDTALSNKDDAWSTVYSSGGTHDVYENAKALYDAASDTISVAQNAYNTALDTYNASLVTLGEAQTVYNNAVIDGDADTITAAQASLDAASKDFNDKDLALASEQSNLDAAKKTYNFTDLETAYNDAKKTFDTTNEIYLDAEEALSTAKSNLDNQTSTLLENYQEELAELYETVSDYTLKAESSGTVTEVNATVGSQTNNSSDLITIDDTASLKIEIQVDEGDIHLVELGQTANILSDATTDTITGTVTSKSPVASVSGQGSSASTFTVTIEINEFTSSLLIGMNAQVDIMLSSVEDVFMAPIDAIEIIDGVSYVYKQIAEGTTEEAFERIEVTTGQSNDYYIEISGSEIQEGLVIRSSAVLAEALVETDEAMMPGMLGGMMSGGAAPSGGTSSGGMSGGQMPNRGNQ